MCKWGQTTLVRVIVPAHLSHSGETYVTGKAVDSCLADVIKDLNAAGIHTAGCCCGHGKGPGSIVLTNGIVIPLPVLDLQNA